MNRISLKGWVLSLAIVGVGCLPLVSHAWAIRQPGMNSNQYATAQSGCVSYYATGSCGGYTQYQQFQPQQYTSSYVYQPQQYVSKYTYQYTPPTTNYYQPASSYQNYSYSNSYAYSSNYNYQYSSGSSYLPTVYPNTNYGNGNYYGW